MSAYADLMAYQRETEALSQVLGRLGWDQETMMPRGAVNQRSEEIAALERVLHARRCDGRIAEWLASAEAEVGDAAGVPAAQLREIRRAYDRATKVPEALAAELARLTSLGHGIWAQARANEDFAAFSPTLAQIVALKQEEAAALADGGDLYDALLQDYEPGATAETVSALFDELRTGLVSLREKVIGSGRTPEALTGTYDTTIQLALSAEIARRFGYDYERGRVDMAVHPFSSGSGSDVRITTRTSEDDPFNCLYSTIHEVGHATYEQNVAADYALTPLGRGASMGVHESQSRIYENQIGRSRAFTTWLYGQMQEHFGADIGLPSDADAFYAGVNRVAPGMIRTEADEVHYNLHIMLRFDLERALIKGDLRVGELQEAWNTRFEADFGVEVPSPSKGVLQDVHWSAGLFGYFPTYTLGNVFAGCLHEALRDAVPDLDAALEQGDPSPATRWLAENLQIHGSLHSPTDTIHRATGKVPSVSPLLAYL
ncbi:MAG: carboxypeptidase M32, partial [Pseudomonadota bacterium]